LVQRLKVKRDEEGRERRVLRLIRKDSNATQENIKQVTPTQICKTASIKKRDIKVAMKEHIAK
jgi:hypothetical protein